MSAFKSAIKPTDAVSQYISKRESIGSVSYTAKKGLIEAVTSPIPEGFCSKFTLVDILAIKGLVST